MSKYFIPALLAMAVAFSALAEDNKASAETRPVVDLVDGRQIVNALIANPDIVENLRKEGLIQAGRMTRQQIQPGVTEYVIRVGACGNCLPKSGTLTITEDMRPSYMDAAVAYDVSLQID
jgi:hypothetical protein